MREAGHGDSMGEIQKCLVGIPEVKRQLVRFRHRWEDNIDMDL
jgi:hypothetical protein